MTINELIKELEKAKEQIGGDRDVVWAENGVVRHVDIREHQSDPYVELL
jgi:hypothetical protein